MKTIRQWFEVLPKQIRNKAINYGLTHNKTYDEEQGETLIDKHLCDNIKDALYRAFVFEETEEGFEYWDNIAFKYLKKTK